MMIRKVMIIAMLLILSIGAASASDNVTGDALAIDDGGQAAEDVNVSGDTFGDIQYAIDVAQVNATINLKGNYTGFDEITIDNDIIIEGNGAILDGDHNSRIISISSGNVILKNMTFINAETITNGGAICSSGNLTLINCNFINNMVYSEYDSYFHTHNHSYGPDEIGDGGAVYSNGDLTVINSSFVDNSAVCITVKRQMGSYYRSNYGDGGAIKCLGNLFVEKSHFAGNSKSPIACKYHSEIMNCIFENQYTMELADVRLIGSSFNNCGRLYCKDLSMENCSFTNSDDGIISCTNAEIIDSTFKNNTDFYSLISCDYASIAGSAFINNSVRNGAVLKLGSYELSGCTFINNTDAAIISNNVMLDDSLNPVRLFDAKVRKVIDLTYRNSGDLVIVDVVNVKTGKIVDPVSEGIDYDVYRNGESFYGYWLYESTTFPVSTWEEGGYEVTVEYSSPFIISDRVTFYVTVINPPTLSMKDVSVYYPDKATFKVKVLDSYGDIVKGDFVSFYVDNVKVKSVKTDDKGYAVITLSKTPNTYKVKAVYSGFAVTKKLTVKHVLALKTVKVKKSAKKLTLQATLKKGKTLLKNKKVTFKFNGKTYKAKTNSKGVAKATVKSSVLKKLKVGKKVTYQATYLKDTVKKTAKVKK